jgi:hypothetical protein
MTLNIPPELAATLEAALYLACDQYEDDARILTTGDTLNYRLADQFKQQAKDCRRLLDIIENA